MRAKRGVKRKRNGDASEAAHLANDHADVISPPDPKTWPGWVEMESEPAFFNVMLQDMGVKGVKVQEIYSLDDEMISFLPQPIYGLIFLFRYRDIDEQAQEEYVPCPDHVWFANQVPEFACATVALLNIVNNVKGLDLGEELARFKIATQDIDPVKRGDAVDHFDFVRRIHNSFATEDDLLQMDVHLRSKAAAAQRKQAVIKGWQTKKAQKNKAMKLKRRPSCDAPPSTESSQHIPKRTAKTGRAVDSQDSSPLSDPPESDGDFKTPIKADGESEKNGTGSRRRSERKPKPRKNPAPLDDEELSDDDGFHFIAYMPIAGHIWKLDGLNRCPQDLGAVDEGNWMDLVRPALQTRMAMYEGADIEFNLMGLVHDSYAADRTRLIQNIKSLQVLREKLDEIAPDWRSAEGSDAFHGDKLAERALEVGVSQADIDSASTPDSTLEVAKGDIDVIILKEIWFKTVQQQVELEGLVRNTLQCTRDDREKADRQRHANAYGVFVRSWLGALADHKLLASLTEAAEA